jgi:hypothetical protein
MLLIWWQGQTLRTKPQEGVNTCMSLTKEAYYRRKWGHYPSLGVLLGALRIPDHYFGWSSASDNLFDWLNRLAEVAVTVKEHTGLLIDASDPQLVERLPEDLRRLESELESAAKFFTEQAAVVRDLRDAYQRDKRL